MPERKLTPLDAARIRARLKLKHKQKDVAKDFGVTRSHVAGIGLGIYHQAVPPDPWYSDRLRVMVALLAAAYRAADGPSEADYEAARGPGGLAEYLACDQPKPTFEQIARALALLAFLPGGVTFAGQHFEIKE